MKHARMRIEYSRHVRNRMRLRKISREQIEEVLSHPDHIFPDPDKPSRLIAQKRCSRRLIEVIHVKEQSKIVVITVI